jgi:hypothetical protein
LVDDEDGLVEVGGAVLGGDSAPSGEGTLGTVSFIVLEGFVEQTELIVSENNFLFDDGGNEKYAVYSVATIQREPLEPPTQGDFDGSGEVDFSDFFLFATAFGGTDPAFDLNNDGEVGFDDFFVFAGNFGQEARGKLIALAQEYLGLPEEPYLDNNYPNPFNSQTTIRFGLPERAEVELAIFNLAGQKVATLAQGPFEAGSYTLSWDGRNEQGQSVASGLYVYRLITGSVTQIKKLTLLR